MARPRVDSSAIQDTIIEIAEALLIESQGQRLVLSDISKRMGVSQPYIHQHFKSKDDLLAELAQRWFKKVESAGQAICDSEQIWSHKIRQYITTTMTLKKQAYEANPELFSAYLTIAMRHKDIVARHTEILRDQIEIILDTAVNARELQTTVDMVLDATVQFRVPAAIVSAPYHVTLTRANLVLDALIAYINVQQSVTTTA